MENILKEIGIPKSMKLTAHGHENIRATHATTLEFTKDSHLTKRGDCIVGVKADYDLEKLKALKGKIDLTIRCGGKEERITAEANPSFSDGKEMVIRKSGFVCKRTFATQADKAAIDLGRAFVALLKNPNSKIQVVVECKKGN